MGALAAHAPPRGLADSRPRALPPTQPAFALDASSAAPPAIWWQIYSPDQAVPPGTFVDYVAIPFLTSNGDIDAFPDGVLWPPAGINSVAPLVALCPRTPTAFPLQADAWEIIRHRTSVYAVPFSLPRGLLPEELTYADVLQNWVKGLITLGEIQHHAPTAAAGTARSLAVDYTQGGILTGDLVLDGSGSFSADADPLRYSWAIGYTPAGGLTLPWNTASLAQQTVLALPAGTPVPEQALGNYIFSLQVTDTVTGTTSGATVEYSLTRLNHAPVANAGLPQVHYLAAGYTLREDMTLDGSQSHDPDGDPLTYSWAQQLQQGACSFTFDGNASIVTLKRAGDTVGPDCVRAFGFALTVRDTAGAVSSAIGAQIIRIVTPDLQFTPGTPDVVTLAQVLDGVTLHVASQSPDDPDLVQPDSYELRIFDQAGTLITTRPVSQGEIQDGITWDGTLRPGYPLTLGTYGFQVAALTAGHELAATEVHQLTVVTVNVTVTGLTEIATGWQAPGTTATMAASVAFPVKADGPAMPELTISIELLGIAPGGSGPLSWDARLEVTYAHDGASDVAPVPPQGWHSLAPGETTWTFTPEVFCGSHVKAYAQAVSGDVTLTGESPDSDTPAILGENPAKAQVRAALGPGYTQIAAYEASQFTQFGGGPPSIFQTFLTLPLEAGGRYGIGGLPDATTEQQWNWQANVTALSQLAEEARADALAYQAQVVTATLPGAILRGTPVAPEFTPQELDLETWTRMQAAGAGYYLYDDTAYAWVRQPPGQSDALDHALAYADRLGHLRAALYAGSTPVHWDDQPGNPPSPAGTPASQILDLCGTGQPLPAIIMAVAAILEPLGWWELWDTLDSLATPVPGARVTVLHGLADAAAASPALDPRIRTALDIVVLLQAGSGIDDAGLLRLQRIAEGLQAQPASQQLLLLEWLGIRGTAAEGIVAAGAAAAPGGAAAAARTADVFGPLPDPLPPFGDWNLPGKMPEPLYLGSAIHRTIGIKYQSVHDTPAEKVFVDKQVAVIAQELARDLPISEDAAASALSRARPDILEWSQIHEIITEGDLFGYEIKPEGGEATAATEFNWYVITFYEAHMPLVPGPLLMPGTAGAIPVPNGWAQYLCPIPGVIIYRYTRAPEEDIANRDEAKGKADSSKYKYQGQLNTAGWAEGISVLGSLILEALQELENTPVPVP